MLWPGSGLGTASYLYEGDQEEASVFWSMVKLCMIDICYPASGQRGHVGSGCD